MGRKKTSRRQLDIISAAAQLFFTKGYDNTSVDEIIKEVGIAKGTFYYYYESKEKLLQEVISSIIDNGINKAKDIVADQTINPLEKVFLILRSIAPQGEDRKQVLDELHKVENAKLHQFTLTEIIIKVTPLISEVIEQAIASGILYTPYPSECAEMFMTIGQFLFDDDIFFWTKEEKEKKMRAFIYLIEKTLNAPEGTCECIMKLLGEEKEHEGV